jgi:hypothetical protein
MNTQATTTAHDQSVAPDGGTGVLGKLRQTIQLYAHATVEAGAFCSLS